MVQNKLPKFLLLAYLVLALTGSSAISAGESLCFEYSNNGSLSSNRYFSSTGHAIDWLAADILTTGKTGGCSYSLPRNRLLTVITSAGTIAAALYPAGANLTTIKTGAVPQIKNCILLKLLT